jgi:oligosaccharide repeat unit polymerase
VFVLIFSGLGILVRKGEARPEASLTENVPALVDGFLWYSLGGIVAFDTVLHEPTRVPPTQSVFRPILVAGSKLGLRHSVPQLHAEYVPIGPGKDMNIYTMYFSYVPEFGVAGTMLVMFVLGAAITAVYWWARKGNTIATLMFSVLFAGIVLSAFAENLVSTMNFTAKLLIFAWALYAWAGRPTASRPSPIDRC